MEFLLANERDGVNLPKHLEKSILERRSCFSVVVIDPHRHPQELELVIFKVLDLLTSNLERMSCELAR